jgi:transposase
MSNLLKNFVGIDISKLTFDAALLKADQPDLIIHKQFQQNLNGFNQFQSWLKQYEAETDEQTLFCMEFTGIYNTALVDFLCSLKAQVWIEPAIKIKKSDGFERSSDDRTDAIKIANYAFRFKERKVLWSPADECLSKIKHLIAQRDRIISAVTKLTIPVNELKQTGAIQQAKEMEKLQHLAIKNLQKAKEKIEKNIVALVRSNQELSRKVARVQTIKGIGEVTTVAFLVYTNGFTSFRNGKQLACYCGVVPFRKKKSGKSVNSKSKVSQYANKKLKRLLHLCALSAISFNPELKSYYERKVLDGKNKMSVINAVRNKLVLRMYAVLRDERDFVENYDRNCA